MGATIGTTTKVISMKSRMKPSRNMTNITISSATCGPPPKLSKKASIISSPPKPLKTREKSAAPIKIKKTMLVVSMVERAISLMTVGLSADLYAAKIIAPTAPTPAASVGVAAPNMIEPSTTVISASGGIIAPMTFVSAVAASSSGGGQLAGLRQPTKSK